MKRRYERVVNGKNMCGEGWAENEVCVRAAQGETAEIACPARTKVESVVWANYGAPVEKDAGMFVAHLPCAPSCPSVPPAMW